MRLHLIDLGGDIAGNGLSKLFFTIAAAFAEAERDRIRERISQSRPISATRGRFLGGARPFGYQIAADGELFEDAVSSRLSPDFALCVTTGCLFGPSQKYYALACGGEEGAGAQRQRR